MNHDDDHYHPEYVIPYVLAAFFAWVTMGGLAYLVW